MARYRFLQDHHIGGLYFAAGAIAATADVGGLLPADWVPTAGVDPLDNAAVNAFHASGPNPPNLMRQQWTGVNVAPPITYWTGVAINEGTTQWSLTGLGAGLPAIVM